MTVVFSKGRWDSQQVSVAGERSGNTVKAGEAAGVGAKG